MASDRPRLHIDPSLHVPRRLSNPTAAEFVEDSRALVRACDESMLRGEMGEREASLMVRAALGDALRWIERRQ